MRLIQNLTISWEMNFYVKNTCQGKVITKKNILGHNNSSGPLYRAIKSKVIFRSIIRQRVAIQKIFFVLQTLSNNKFIEQKKLGYLCFIYRKNRFFKFFVNEKLTFAQKNFQAPGMMSDQFGIKYKMFPIVELTKLGGQNIK